ncbi:fibronectin type III domain-containing protein [Candidatus Parcubacteria bacterium]|nr:fibronectin type III domain-containing protein [Candidatus Parcubacteria bacterium]
MFLWTNRKQNNFFKKGLTGLIFVLFVFALIGLGDIDPVLGQSNKQEAGNYELGMNSSQNDFAVNQLPKMEFEFAKKRRSWSGFKSWMMSMFVDEYKDMDIKTEIVNSESKLNAEIKAKINYLEDGKFSIEISEKPRRFRPGVYTINIAISDEDMTGGETINFNQDFSWGVLAINTNKSVYLPSEEAYLQMGVLDDSGHTLCNAQVFLEIIAPDGGVAYLNSDNGLIINNPKCGADNYIESPDYYAYYGLGGIGIYKIKLRAITENGEHEIYDEIKVRNSLPFEIERVGPTRINPTYEYEMKIVIKANEEFSGDVVECAPSQFSISNIQYSSNFQYPISNIQINEVNNEKEFVIKDLNLKQDDIFEFTYTFDAPDISPEFYLLGPLRVGEYFEGRQWQIASDDVGIYIANAGTNVGWTNGPNGYDNIDDSYASRDIPRRSVLDSANYLEGNANNAPSYTYVITKVEIGIEGYIESSNVTPYMIPRFNGSTNGSSYAVSGLTTSDPTDTTYWANEITNDVNGPGADNWTWSDIQNLDIRVYGSNSHNSQPRFLYIDQIRIQVTYDANVAPTASFDSISQKSDGTGVVDIAVIIDDDDDDNEVRLKVEHQSGATCPAPGDPTLDEIDANATSTNSDDPKVENDNEYQIGNSSGWINTSEGANTVSFDWLSDTDASNANGIYCVQVTPYDGVTAGTAVYTTVTLDNYPPQISNVTFSPSSGVLKIGDTATATIISDNTGYTAGAITINSVDAASTLVDNGDNTYSVSYTVAEGNTDIVDSANLPISFVLKDSNNNSSDAYTSADISGRPGVDAHKPSISTITITNSAYKIGDTVTLVITVTSDTDTYSLNAASTVNNISAQNLSKVSDTAYNVDYVVGEGDTDRSAGTVPISIVLNDTAGNANAPHTALAANSASVDAHRPTISNVTIPNTAMKVADLITATFTVGDDGGDTYDIVSGTIGGFTLSNFIRSSSTTYTAQFTITEGGTDVLAGNNIPVASVVIDDTAGNQSATYATPISQSSDSIDANTPVINSVSFSPSSGILIIGEIATATIGITVAESGLLSGSTMTINGVNVISTFNDINGSSCTVTYIVAEGHTDRSDSDDLPVVFHVRDLAGNESSIYNTGDFANRPGVDGHKPTISNITIPNTTMKVNDTVTATFTIGDDGGETYSLSSGTINGFALSNFTRSNSTTYTAQFTITEGGNDVASSSNISVANVVITDVATNQSAVYATPILQDSDAIDANTPTISNVSFDISSGVLIVGSTTLIAISSDGTGYSAGTITVNEVDVASTLAPGAGNDYTISYTVAEGHIDRLDSADLPINISLTDTAGNESAAYTSADINNRPGVDGHAPTISNITIPNTTMKVNDTVTATFTTEDDGGETYSLSSGTINGFALSNFTRSNSTTYTAQFTITEGGADVASSSNISVANVVISDVATNQSAVYATPISQDSDAIDANTPTAPGNLTFNSKASDNITLNFGATTTEVNFSEYKIYYKQAASGVSESDTEFNSTHDSNLGDILYQTATTVTIDGLATGTQYVFNIWAYDIVGNKSMAISEIATTTNYAPSNPASLTQLKNDGVTQINNGIWTNEDNIKLKASVNDNDFSEILTLYFELATSTDAFVGNIVGACAVSETWDACSNKVWKIMSAAGDYSSVAYTGEVNPTDIPDSVVGYKWRVMACDDNNECTDWTDAGADPNFKVDHSAPDTPGDLSENAKTSTSITLNFGATTTEANFREYIIYYKAGSSGVTESNLQHGSSSDENLLDIDFNDESTTTIDSLSAGTEYVINIWAYDEAGNKANASEITVTTDSAASPPVASFNSVSQEQDGSGRINISIEVDDPDNDDTLRARIDYVAGVACDFSSPQDPSLDENGAYISQDYGDVDVDNTSEYQVGTTTGWIWTSPGSNTVEFDWLSKTDLPETSGDYCLQLTVNDGTFSQISPATATIAVYNTSPASPGSLNLNSKTSYSLTLNFGATTTASNFQDYKIYYKEGSSGVTEGDSEHDDPDLDNILYNNTATTTINNLSPGTEYVINIWAYDTYGNKASATAELTATTNYLPNNPSSPAQFKNDGVSAIANGDWTEEDVVELTASVLDSDTSEVLTLYFELITDIETFATATTAPFGACASSTAYEDCSSKFWQTASAPGNYSITPFIGFIKPTGISDSSAGFKWQVLACDDNGSCSEWTVFNATSPNFKLDNTLPANPGALSLASYNSYSITLNFGATTTEDNFSEYKIFYKQGTSGVTEDNDEFNFSDDANLAFIDFDEAATTSVSGLLAGLDYVFNIYAYDEAGNIASSTQEFTYKTNNLPIGFFSSASTRIDGSGAVDLSIQVDDIDDEELQAKIEYEAGASCLFVSADKLTLDATDANATSTYDDAKIDNNNDYQIGDASGWITTASGQNTVNFDWLSQSNLPEGDGAYCLRLTVNDQIEDQSVSATTTITIDNAAPTVPGYLSLYSSDSSSITLEFGTTTTETNFKEYKIYYKEGVSAVDEGDTPHADSNLGDILFYGAATTTIELLDENKQYSFKIFAYDDYGNKSNSSQTTISTNALPTGDFNPLFTAQKTDGSGVVDVSIEVYDVNGEACIAKLEYVLGAGCDFSSPEDPTLDEDGANIAADHGDPDIGNNNVYQIGTSTKIITNLGANTVEFDWDSKSDIPNANGTYCLRLTVNDGTNDQAISATTTLTVDNTNPADPGNLSAVLVSGLEIEIGLGATTTETNFKEYKIFYKESTPGVTESDSEFNQYDDNSLADIFFDGANAVTINGLEQNTDYYFNIWAYDNYGNKASATEELATTTIIVPSATWREYEDYPDPATSTPIGRQTPVRLRVAISNVGDWDSTNYAYQIEYGVKNGDCASADPWISVPINAGTEHFSMYDSPYFNNQDATFQKFVNSESYSYAQGYMVKSPSASTSPLTLSQNEYTEIEYAIIPTVNAEAGETYCFRLTYEGEDINIYEKYPELTLVPKPTGSFVSAEQKIGGNGVVDISILVTDLDHDPSIAKIEYVQGGACDFGSPADPTLDENIDNIQHDYGNPIIINANEYQIGTGSNKIITQYGPNTIGFDWDSFSDIPDLEDTYCLRLTVNDGYDDQYPLATTTLTVDNKDPSSPGNLTVVSKTDNSVTLEFGATSSDNNFFEYKIFYKQAASGVTESDSAHSSSTDENLGYADFQGAATTTITGLIKNNQYVFKIWAYDQFGNKSYSSGEVTTKLVPSYYGAVYSDEGLTPLLTAPTISIAINGVYERSIAASAVDGSFVFEDIDPQATGTPIVIYIDGKIEKGVAYNRYSGQGEVTGFDIYQNRIIVRHDDAGPLTVANINSYDSDQDNDISCAVTGTAFNVASGNKLYVWQGSQFESGSGNITIDDMEICGQFTAIGEQVITVAGNWEAAEGLFTAASSTVEFTSTSTGKIIKTNNQPFWNLTLNGAGGEWTLFDSSTTTATTTIAKGTLIQGEDVNFETGSMLIENEAVFVKASGTGILIFEDQGEGFFEDRNTVINNLGNVQIGYSPAVTNLNSDFVADSLTVSSGDSFYTRGYEVGITNFITVYGTFDCLDNKEGDGTIITLGGNWTVDASGAFVAANATTTFDGTADATLSSGGVDANHDFYNLSFAKSSLASTSLVNNNLKTSGDLNIGSNSILDVSSNNYDINAAGNWINNGEFWAENATTTFDALSTGKIINPGSSVFNRVVFANASGGWTITDNATSTGNWEINNASAFTVAANVKIEVQGEYIITDTAPNVTVWNSGSELFLNSGTAYNIASKNQSSENYSRLRVGANTDIKQWNTGAGVFTVDSTGSLYSQDHANVNGDLYIWGDYNIDAGIEYWAYATDFDGANLSGTERQCDVRIANNSSIDISNSILNIVGTSAATTTIANQGSGDFSLSVATTTLAANYFQFRNTDANGLNLSGTTSIDSFNNGDFELSANGGAMIKVAASVIDANPWATSTNIRFATSTGITSGYNVILNSTSSYPWTFTEHYGHYAGEDYDSDPGDPRGYIVWDDSPSYSPKSQNWRWYHDEDSETPVIPAALENYAPQIVGDGNLLKLRLSIKETENILGKNVKMRLQYSTDSSFASNVYFVGEQASTTALWTYGDGVDDDNDLISALLLTDSVTKAAHNESGISTSSFNHAKLDTDEWEFTVCADSPATSTTYYFRGFCNYYSLYGNFEKAVLKNDGSSYPSVIVSSAVLSFNVSGLPSGTSTENITIDVPSTATSVPFGILPIGSKIEAGHRFTITTNAEMGYQLFVYQRQALLSNTGADIDPVAGTNENPGLWPANPNPSAFGYHTGDDNLSGSFPARFSSDERYAQFDTNLREISYSSLPVNNETVDLIYRVEVSDLQAAGDYTTNIVYVLAPNY